MTTIFNRICPAPSRTWLMTAAGGMVVVRLVIWSPAAVVLGAILAIAALAARHPVAACALALATGSAFLWVRPMPHLEAGALSVAGVMASDLVEGRYGPWAIVDTEEGPILANFEDGFQGRRGDRLSIRGVARDRPGQVREWRYLGVIEVEEVMVTARSPSLFQQAGTAMRERVRRRLSPLSGGSALVAGFLVGDTTGVDPLDQEAMKRAGISHFTAVSGSNVALFLGVLFVLAGPLGIGAYRRPVVGLLGLPVFVAATGFEPSVMRAAVMAAVVLAARLIGIGMEAWQVMSVAVLGLLVLEPGLVGNAGFELSVAATAGVIVGARWPLPTPRIRPLAVTMGAQLAVAPVLLIYFGRVPLLSPLINLVAAPLVSFATICGTFGVMAVTPLLGLASWVADIVLVLARTTSAWPQIGWAGLATAVGIGVAWWCLPRMRGVLAAIAAGLIVWSVVVPAHRPPMAGVVVFDVGQGDSILLSGGDGHYALVDGGVDPAHLMDKLVQYGVDHLDLMVPTHGDADHAMGLTGVPGRIPVSLVWASMAPHETEASRLLLSNIVEYGIPVESPEVGETFELGSLVIVVDGPLRRYAAPNDQSIVLTVTGPSRSILLTGDIGAIAQHDLVGLTADVLKVPHHGSGTSDPEWLKAVDASLSVISVGPNTYGHPAHWVIDLLRQSGSAVLRTDQMGDVSVSLG